MGLVDDVQLARVERSPQIRQQSQALDGVDVEFRGVHADAITLELGVIERNVDVLHERLAVGAVDGCDGDPHARPHDEFEVLDGNRRVERREQVPSHEPRVGQPPVDDDRELVSAEAVHRRVLGSRSNEPLGYLAQDDVAHRVAQRVVDVLEVVQVEQHEAGAANGRFPRSIERAVKIEVQLSAIAETGERVVRRGVGVLGGRGREEMRGDHGRRQERQCADSRS